VDVFENEHKKLRSENRRKKLEAQGHAQKALIT